MAKIIIEMPLKNFVFQLSFQQTTIVKTKMPLDSSKLARTQNESKGYATSTVQNQNYNVDLKNPK
jgi:hypothetical protein